MMRVNAYTTNAVHKRLIGWCHETGVDTSAHRDSLNDVGSEHFEELVIRLFHG